MKEYFVLSGGLYDPLCYLLTYYYEYFVVQDDHCEHLFDIAFIVAYLSISFQAILNPCIYKFIGKSGNRLKWVSCAIVSFVQATVTRLFRSATSSLRILLRTRSTSPCNSPSKQTVSSSPRREDKNVWNPNVKSVVHSTVCTYIYIIPLIVYPLEEVKADEQDWKMWHFAWMARFVANKSKRKKLSEHEAVV